MKQEQKQEIALMRYRAIAPLVAGLDDSFPSQTAFYEAVSAKGITTPDGRLRHFAPATIERWYCDYNKYGFDGLIPKGRADAGISRKLDPDLQGQIRYLKTNYPRMSAAAIFRQLSDNGSISHGQVSESTVCRFVNRLQEELHTTPNRDMRHYERPHINEVWCGDSSVGPKLTDPEGRKRRVFIIALIDDASRFIVGIDIFYQDTFINLMSVLKSAVAKHGCPKVLNFDNGKSYRNKQMELLAARIGTTLSYCQPYTPTGKAKIERWFRTMKDQWMASLALRDLHSLDELRDSLFAFVHQCFRLDYLLSTKGFGLLTGSPGRGKTTAIRSWAASLNPSLYKVIYSSLSTLTVMEFYRNLAAGFGLQPVHRKSENFRLIQEEINRLVMEKRITPVIIIDEANYISGPVLNDLKILFNFEMDSRDRAVVLLAELPQLNNTLRLGIHEPLRQRLVMNYDLDGLSKEEGRLYIQTKLEGAGCHQPVFEDNAIEAILNAANGTPRLINKLCNASLLIGNSSSLNIITADAVMQAISDCELG